MSALKHLQEDYQAFRAKLGASASHLLSEFDGLFGKLLGEAKADAADVEQQAEVAAAPVVHAAEQDAAQVAKDAEAGAAAVVEGTDKPSA